MTNKEKEYERKIAELEAELKFYKGMAEIQKALAELKDIRFSLQEDK